MNAAEQVAFDKIKRVAQNMKNLADTVGGDVEVLLVTEDGAGPVPLDRFFHAVWLNLNDISTGLLLSDGSGTDAGEES